MGCEQSKERTKHVKNVDQELLALSYNFQDLSLVAKEPVPETQNTNNQTDFLLPVYGVKHDLYPFKALVKRNHEEKFYDKDFPGLECSLFSYKNQLRNKIDGCDWKKPCEYMDQNQKTIQVFEDDIEPNDIKQGNLSDCYFLSALSAIADTHPSLIRQLFVTQKYSEMGLYCVYLNIMGHWQQVCVDDRVPCFTDGGPIFSRCHGNELWVVLLEKAYAKSYKTYGNIESGYPGLAFRDITGAPSEYLMPVVGQTHLKPDDAYSYIERGLTLNYILTASSEKDIAGVEVANQTGIISEHCYAILACSKVVDSEGHADQIIKMRNPWGHKEWSGDWGDQSSKWTEALKLKLNVEDKDDGIFWISKTDFITQFNTICESKIHPKYLYSSYQITDGCNPIARRLLIMRVFKPTHGFITASQKDARVHPLKNYKYGLVRLVIAKIDIHSSQVIECVAHKLESERDVYCEAEFSQGDYLIYVETEWYGDWSKQMTISTYTQHAVHLTELDVTDEFCEQVLDSIIKVHVSPQSKDYGDKVTKQSGFLAGYLYFFYQNKSIASTLIETVQMLQVRNLKVCPPQLQEDSFKVSVQPQDTKLIKYRVTINDNGSYSYQTQIKYAVEQAFTNELLIQQCKLSVEKTTQRKIKGEPIEVYFSVYNHQCGTALLYQNKTSRVFSEVLTLKLNNLSVMWPQNAPNLETEPLKITIPAKGEYLISLKTIDSQLPNSYTMSMQFKLT